MTWSLVSGHCHIVYCIITFPFGFSYTVSGFVFCLRFNLKEKEGEADRKVPLQTLAFLAKDGSVSRYNLRKVTTV